MDHHDKDQLGRRSIIAGVGVAAAALAAGNSAQAQSRRRNSRGAFEPTRHALDAWYDELPGNHRIFVDSGSAEGGAEAVGYSNNLFAATASGYPDEPADLALIVCFRHASTPFGYNDRMWEKYGESFESLMDYKDPETGAAPKLNLMNSANHRSLGNRGVTIDSLASRGVQFAICGMATQLFSSVVAQRTGQNSTDVNAELVANSIPNSHFVPAGVIALTRAQEYGYSVLIAG